MEAVRDDINPFALMLDPEGVFKALEQCEGLARLKRRICRPLEDPPLGEDIEPEMPAQRTF